MREFICYLWAQCRVMCVCEQICNLWAQLRKMRVRVNVQLDVHPAGSTRYNTRATELNNVYQALGGLAAQFAGARRGLFKMYTKYCTFPSVENKVKG